MAIAPWSISRYSRQKVSRVVSSVRRYYFQRTKSTTRATAASLFSAKKPIGKRFDGNGRTSRVESNQSSLLAMSLWWYIYWQCQRRERKIAVMDLFRRAIVQLVAMFNSSTSEAIKLSTFLRTDPQPARNEENEKRSKGRWCSMWGMERMVAAGYDVIRWQHNLTSYFTLYHDTSITVILLIYEYEVVRSSTK